MTSGCFAGLAFSSASTMLEMQNEQHAKRIMRIVVISIIGRFLIIVLQLHRAQMNAPPKLGPGTRWLAVSRLGFMNGLEVHHRTRNASKRGIPIHNFLPFAAFYEVLSPIRGKRFE
jgi:hypothetical protein